ncbi:hypothetical protein Clacol_001259 [Clathrus columnatus]|uniref:RNA polymerase II assembly factor Rtp1 C-terminal domain-containing protein n=1 Tax=Clathrus columnatus TaxID=1419009 RepID=A0AAV5A589_9AGAM|nr:hypothetical protein Clacol_001259 [Clathrus columnatus]
MSDSIQQCQKLLLALRILSGAEGKTIASPDLATVLRTRLTKVNDVLNEYASQDFENIDLKKLQYVTATRSLRIMQILQDILDQEGMETPLLGTRDIAYVKTVLSIIFNWGVEPLLADLERNCLGSQGPGVDQPLTIIDLTDGPTELPTILVDIMHLIFEKNSKKIRQSWITSSLLSNHAVDLLTPLLILGWPSNPVLGSLGQKQQFKEFSIRFISLSKHHVHYRLRTPDATSALGTILASVTSKRRIYPHLPKACGFLLSKLLLRPDGVQGLYAAIFGEGTEDGESAPLDKLEQIVKILTAVPASMSSENYFAMIAPKVIALLSPSTAEKVPAAYKRASAFTLSRMLIGKYHQITTTLILPFFHKPFQLTPSTKDNASEELLSAMDSLLTLQAYLLNTDPSPENKTADPSVRETIFGLLVTWSRVASSTDVIDGIWKIISGYGGDWDLTLEGWVRSASNTSVPSISLQSVAEMDGKPRDDIDIDANPFDLRPDPVRFVAFMKTMDRKDVSSDIFLRLLNGYQELKNTDRDEDAIRFVCSRLLISSPLTLGSGRTLLYLQLILQMQARLSDVVVSKPQYILAFIKHALSSLPKPPSLTRPSPKKGLTLKDLRIVPEIQEEEQTDSDDEDAVEPEGSGRSSLNLERDSRLMEFTGNPDLSPQTNPVLNDISSILDNIASNSAVTPTLRQLAREARVVLLARSASTSSDNQTKTTDRSDRETAHDIYQKALKLLQDPIIPVRAHGVPAETRLDPALLPGILSIFLQSIQDQESYIFLNAVQGLAAMVDGYGKDVLKGIMDVYLQGSGIGRTGTSGSDNTMTKDELDARIRIGEALNTVVRRCGGALGSYVDILLPPLLVILRSGHLPTTLRVSSLSILAQCALTNVAALDSYAANLVDTCLEIIKLEHVPVEFSKEKGRSKDDIEIISDDDGKPQKERPSVRPRQPDVTDSDPTTSATKVPSLRRSALHFLAQLFRAYVQNQYDVLSRQPEKPSINIHITPLLSPASERDSIFPQNLLRRANIVLSYVNAVDQDPVTKVMSNETLELVAQFQETRLLGSS